MYFKYFFVFKSEKPVSRILQRIPILYRLPLCDMATLICKKIQYHLKAAVSLCMCTKFERKCLTLTYVKYIL